MCLMNQVKEVEVSNTHKARSTKDFGEARKKPACPFSFPREMSSIISNHMLGTFQ